jgi:hypothetical protein
VQRIAHSNRLRAERNARISTEAQRMTLLVRGFMSALVILHPPIERLDFAKNADKPSL